MLSSHETVDEGSGFDCPNIFGMAHAKRAAQALTSASRIHKDGLLSTAHLRSTARVWARGLSLLLGFPHSAKTSETVPTLDGRVQVGL